MNLGGQGRDRRGRAALRRERPSTPALFRTGAVVVGLLMLLLATAMIGGDSPAAAAESAAEKSASRPNIIFVVADDLGYGELGCYGQKLIHTPHLDRPLAAEEMHLTDCYAGSTVCATFLAAR